MKNRWFQDARAVAKAQGVELNKRLCWWCGKSLPARKQRYCSPACIDEVWVRIGGSTCSNVIYRRDKGICAKCGLDTVRFKKSLKEFCEFTRITKFLNKLKRRSIREQIRPGYNSDRYRNMFNDLRKRKKDLELEYQQRLKIMGFNPISSLWEVDHIIRVEDGGGMCGADNLQTLCVPCHKEKTTTQRLENSKQRKLVK